ncbi:MAG: hypothetical protein RJA49_2603 [Actinomycetota bacterium]|jgi:cytochrome c-type biogenesis protein
MSLGVVAVALYGAGVAAALSPCVLPLVPGWLVVLADGGGRRSRSTRMAAFCAGAVLTFTLLGSVVAAFASVARFSARSQQIAGVAVLMSAAAAQMSRRGRIRREWHLRVTLPDSPLLRAAALGVGCGAAWTPCVGPLLGVALTAAGGGGSVGAGALLLFLFGLGTLTPFLAVGALRTPTVPPTWRAAGVRLQRATPVLLAVVGVLLVSGRYDALVQRLPSGM